MTDTLFRRFKLLAVMLFLAVLALPAQARKKNNYEITLKINGGRDTVMYLGCYFAKGNRVVDTARLDKKGRFVFASNRDTLAPGLYFFANPAGTYAEFVVYGEKPFFDFETKQSDWTSNMQVRSSEQNQFFFDFHRIDKEIQGDLSRQGILMDSADFKAYERQQLRRLDSTKMALINSHPEMFLSKMMLITKDEIPPLVDASGDTLTDYQRRDWYLEHYFDNIPLEDNAIIRTPKMVFYQRVMTFFDECLQYAEPSVIIHHIDRVLGRAQAAPDIFAYLVTSLTQKYLQSNISIYDEIYVHLVNNYYATEANFWSAPSSISKEAARAAKWERLLAGKEAPELILFDTLRVPHSLHAMPNKWKLLVFWSPNCGHCQHIIPAIYDIFVRYSEQYDIGAFTILSDPDDKTRKEWREFMQKHGMNSPAWLSLDGGEANVDWHDIYDIQTTPQIYLIDQNNIIQVKKLGESSLEGILKHYCGKDTPSE